MKNFLKLVLLMSGLVLVAFGNNWGLLGILPVFLQIIKEDIKDEVKSF